MSLQVLTLGSLLTVLLTCTGCGSLHGEFFLVDERRFEPTVLPAQGEVFVEAPQLAFEPPLGTRRFVKEWQTVFRDRVLERAAPVQVKVVPEGGAPATGVGLKVQTRVYAIWPPAVREGAGDLVWTFATVSVRELGGRLVWLGRLEAYGSVNGPAYARIYDFRIQVGLTMHHLACAVSELLRTGKAVDRTPQNAVPDPWARVDARFVEGCELLDEVADEMFPRVVQARAGGAKLAAADVAATAARWREATDVLSLGLERAPAPSTFEARSSRARITARLGHAWALRGVLLSPEVAAEGDAEGARASFTRALDLVAPFDPIQVMPAAAVELWSCEAFALRGQAGLLIAQARGEVSEEARTLLARAAELFARAGGEWADDAEEARRLAGPS